MNNTSSYDNPCVACGGPTKIFGRRDSYNYYSCQKCKSIQLVPFPSREELDKAYSEDYAASGHNGNDPILFFKRTQPLYDAIHRELIRRITPPAKILDYGCGWGGMCRYLNKAGYDYLGIDYPSASLEYGQKTGLNLRAATLEDLYDEGQRFSAIILCAVFEHLQNHSETLNSLKKILEPGGLLIILIPSAGLFGRLAKMIRWIRKMEDIPALGSTFSPPWHTVIFSVDGMHQILTDNGYEKLQIRPSPSGNSSGLEGLAKKTATMVAKIGFWFFGTRWPLVLNHIFVYKIK